MTRTVVGSATREVVIGDDRPFVVIGERINPTGRKLLAEEMKNGDFSRVERDAIAQVEAGAHMLDVNAGIPLADEPAILAKTIQLVQSLTDLPLSIDSSIVEALEAGLAVYRGKALVNSVTGEDERLERVLPLVKKYGAAVVAISNDETGISEDPDVRFAVAKRIVERAADHGIPREDVIVDPLLMPIGAMPTAGRQVFRILGRLRDELGVNSTCGASNVSFGLPNREGINGAFLAMAIASRPDVGDHEPDRRGRPDRRHGRRRPPGQRPGRGPLDPAIPGRAARGRGRRPARQPPAGRRRAAAADRRDRGRRGGRRLTAADPAMTADPLVIFTPSGRRGRFATGTTVLDAARKLGVDIDSVCGGRGICGRCQVEQSVGEFAKHGIVSSARPPDAVRRRSRRPTAMTRASPTTAGWPARRMSAATSSSTSRPRARSTARSSGRASTSATSTSTRSSGSTTSRSSRPQLASPSGDLHRAPGGARARVGPPRSRGRPPRHPGAPAGARGGQVRRHGRGP